MNDGIISKGFGGRTPASGGTLVMRVGYQGAGFAGYAEQPGQRSVAGVLREAVETLLRREASLTCAGRTDAGVHAVAQHVSVPVSSEELLISRERLMRGLAALTPDDVSVRDIFRAAPGFSARFDATGRRYRYRVASGARPVHGWGRVWWLRKAPSLDVDAMDEAAALLLGEHDFTSFCKASSAELIHEDGRSTCRCVTDVAVRRLCECDDDVVVIDVAANAFLHNMVRVIVGSLVEVGRGARSASSMAEALAARDRRAAGPTAPAHGLTFQEVSYPAGSLAPWQRCPSPDDEVETTWYHGPVAHR